MYEMKPKFIDYFMKIAELTAALSYAKRLQVGAVIVKGNQTIGTGYNGMPTEWENNCEYKEYLTDPEKWVEPYGIEERYPHEDEHGRYRWVTKPETLHSEMNALMKVAQSTESSTGSAMFCTHAPCMDCAKAIYQAGIATLYYQKEYRSTQGVEFLKKSGVNVIKYEPKDK